MQLSCVSFKKIEEYVHMVKDGIIDPVKVIQTTLQNAARTSTLMMARSIMLNELGNVEVDDSLLVVQSHETGFKNKKWSLDDGGGGHRGVDNGDPLGGGDPQQVMLALHQARRHELTPFRRPTPHQLGVHLHRRLLAHELHQNSLARD
ncbi:uncharacterized protein LOC119297397 [Triticum dicoccoides]|uniref:uncharacterized protein LOC119297397 n=1 Tax=Triticum dicoccoides TaxID=85692 RepID=UPI00188F0D92|nr:uncharacterized protein LOC119297397 [Triticum dicoccoides]